MLWIYGQKSYRLNRILKLKRHQNIIMTVVLVLERL